MLMRNRVRSKTGGTTREDNGPPLVDISNLSSMEMKTDELMMVFKLERSEKYF